MLSERERQALDDIERRLTFDDPDLAARLRTGSMPAATQHLRPALAVVLVTVAMAVAMVSVLAGQWGVAATAAGAGVGWIIWRTLRSAATSR